VLLLQELNLSHLTLKYFLGMDLRGEQMYQLELHQLQRHQQLLAQDLKARDERVLLNVHQHHRLNRLQQNLRLHLLKLIPKH
tara:strand:- start:45 stop:290 length:246 start_codon:yes stop_codon:yes gene_type:complete